jgi:hypothetical protein
MHVSNNGSPLYCAEANARMGYYQSPYYTPWLYRDGVSVGSGYSAWRSGIVTRMNQPSNMTQTQWGSYNTATRTGTINARYRNDSTISLTGRAYFVVTEDSCYYVGSNGDAWHNHVARDYLPNQLGTLGTIAAGDSAAFTQSFTINASWNANRCKIISWFQLSDGSRINIQAGIQKVTDLPSSVEETPAPEPRSTVTLSPNPCRDKAQFRFQVPKGSEYRIRIFDITGRQVRLLSGASRSDIETVNWNCRDDQDKAVGSGAYLYRFESQSLNTSGKIVVK